MSKFKLADWEKRKAIAADTERPWGEYHVLQDFSVDEKRTLTAKILNALHEKFAQYIIDNPEAKQNELISKLADPSYNLANEASADEKILVIEPKQSGFNALSMQYHGRPDLHAHIEIFELLTPGSYVAGSDIVRPYGWTKEEAEQEIKNLKVKHFKPGDIIVTLPGQWHAYAMPSTQDLMVLREWRITPEPGRTSDEREGNIVRLYDNAGRGTLGNFPQEIMQEIG
jgi:hypothetical protein